MSDNQIENITKYFLKVWSNDMWHLHNRKTIQHKCMIYKWLVYMCMSDNQIEKCNKVFGKIFGILVES